MGEIFLECFQELSGTAIPCLEYSHLKMKVSVFTKQYCTKLVKNSKD